MNANIVIVGLGESGFACVRYFADLHIPVVVIDNGANPPKLAECQKHYPGVPICTGSFPKEILAKATTLILSPGIPKDHPDIISAVSPHVEIIGDIEVFARNVKAPVVAITGSNGKSTVTTLVGEMAKAAGIRVGVGGNLGIPALTLLRENFDLYILELSSFQLETTDSLKPKVATILNLCPDHLDRYSSLEVYREAKYRIFRNCEQVVVNRADPFLPSDMEAKQKFISFGLDVPKEHHYGLLKNPDIWLARGEVPLIPAAELRLFGQHNIANALAALALGESIGLPMSAMLSVLQTFRGLPHRCEWVREYRGVQWINDSKGTNVGATLAALEGVASSISGKWILIAGGIGKEADFTPLRLGVSKACAAVVLIGEAKEELYEVLHSVVPCIFAEDMKDAVHKALQQANKGDGVLLSPACASFDMFTNFAARGDAFRTVVLGLQE